MAGYTLVTFQQLITALSTRLSDPNNVFWSSPELQVYIKEALQTWQAHSQFYSTKATFPSAAGVMFYDLTVQIPQLAPTITDQALIETIEYCLQEPINPDGWSGTEQFNLVAITQAIQNRRDRFILETGLAQTLSGDVPGPTPPTPTFELGDTVVDLRRVMWKDIDTQIYTLMWKADEYAFLGGNTQWFNTPGLPIDWSVALQQPLSLQLSPPPLNLGWLNMISVNIGPILSPSIGPTVLGIPDDFVWVVKFGAMADLFSTPGPGSDPTRAAYCETRWTDGIELARITNFVKLGQQNGVPVFVDALIELDTASPGWVSATPGPPQSLVVSGNIAAVSPVPDTNGPYSVLFDITPKMILPQSLTDYIQLGDEFIDIILDYAQHLATLKEGSAELGNTYQLYKNFVKIAMVENDSLRANAGNFDVLSDRSILEARLNPRRQSDMALGELGQQ